MSGFVKIYTVQSYDAVHDIPRVQVFQSEYRAWQYFFDIRRELLSTREYASHLTEGYHFEGYLTDNAGRDYIEYKAWDTSLI